MTNTGSTHHELKSLQDIFNGRRFQIPAYQREYSWEKANRKDLMNDIAHVIRTNYKHYTGTIVAIESKSNQNNQSEPKGTNDERIFDIIDGQQRLTSLIILIWELLKYEDAVSLLLKHRDRPFS